MKTRPFAYGFLLCTLCIALLTGLPAATRSVNATASAQGANVDHSAFVANLAQTLRDTVGQRDRVALPPGPFAKLYPAKELTGVSINPTLSWSTSSGATSYDYCIDQSNDNACDDPLWKVVGNTTTTTVSGLSPNTTYYWQIRASTSPTLPATDADNGIWWRFTTALAPGAFGKSSPGDGATNVSIDTTLGWGISSNATSYEYCLKKVWDFYSTCVNVGGARSVSLNGLAFSTDYVWSVRAIGPGGVVDANNGTSWYFKTWPPPPGYFNKSLPNDNATEQPTHLALSWDDSPGASGYRYCVDTSDNSTCNGSWSSTTGTSSGPLNGLSLNTTYYWQVQAHNPGYSIDSNGGWWQFTTARFPPAFNKSSPANNATAQSIYPTLTWGDSVGATGYEYCYDTVNNNTCDDHWRSSALITSVTLYTLAPATQYYWHVRAIGGAGATESTGGWWNFTTAPPPGAFVKATPLDGAAGVPANPTLNWTSSSRAMVYEYCYDTIDNGTCDGAWLNAGMGTGVALDELVADTTYYWQIRAVNPDTGVVEADSGSWWHFTVVPLPGDFNKSNPAAAASGQPNSLNLIWTGSSGATGYEYCYDTNNNATCDGTWVSAGLNLTVTVSSLSNNQLYFWQVRALNPGGTIYANSGNWWQFTIGPAPTTLSKLAPADRALNQTANPLLQWAGGISPRYYCYDTTDNDVCDGPWNSTSATSIQLTHLSPNTTYYWQVRDGANNEANSGAWWRFSTAAPPGDFSLSLPARGAANQRIGLTLSWLSSVGATGYQYCIDTMNDNTCNSTWSNAGMRTSATLSTLGANTTYYWMVRALNADHMTYADGNIWWSFTTAPLPGGLRQDRPGQRRHRPTAQPRADLERQPRCHSLRVLLRYHQQRHLRRNVDQGGNQQTGDAQRAESQHDLLLAGAGP